MSPAKLNLGFPTYGRTQSAAGQYTAEPGIMGNDLSIAGI
jgi:hypothetical protein